MMKHRCAQPARPARAPRATARRARLHAGRDSGRHHHHRPDHGPRRPARAQLPDRIEGQGREDPDRELRERARSVLPRYRPLSERSEGLAALVQRPGSIAVMERAVPEGRRRAHRSLGQALRLSLAGTARHLRHRLSWRGWDRRWNRHRTCRHHQLGSADRGRPRRASRCSRSCASSRSWRSSPPSWCRRCRAAPRARGWSPMRSRRPRCSRPTATPRCAVACRSRPRSTPWRAIRALGRDRPRRSACPTTWRSTRSWRRAAISVRPDRRSTSSRRGMSCGGAIALTRLGVGYQIRVNWLTGGVEVVPFEQF